MFGFGDDDNNSSHELIPIKLRDLGGELTQIINARDLHCGLGIGRDFSTWIKGRIERGQFVEDRDYVVEILDPQNGGSSERACRGSCGRSCARSVPPRWL